MPQPLRVPLMGAIILGVALALSMHPSVRSRVRSPAPPEIPTFFSTAQPAVRPPNQMHLIPLTTLEGGYGSHLATGADPRAWVSASPSVVYLWRDGVLEGEFPTPGDAIQQVALSADGRQVLASPHRLDLTTRQWQSPPSLWDSLGDGLDPDLSDTGSFVVDGGAWSRDGQVLVVSALHRPSRRRGRAANAWSGPTNRLLALNGSTGQMQQVLWDGRGQQYRAIEVGDRAIIAAYLDIRVWDRRTYQPLATLEGHTAAVRQVRLSAEGDRLVSVGANGQVMVWATADWQQLAAWQAHDDDVPAVAFHPTHPLIATGGWDRQVKLWSFDGTLLAQVAVEGRVEGVSFTVTGDRLIVAQGGPQAKLLVFALEGAD